MPHLLYTQATLSKMKRILLLLFTITFAISCSTSEKIQQTSSTIAEDENNSSSNSDAGGPPTKQQLIGFWKMVEFPKKEMNQVDPWPLPYQWFAFYEDGKVYSMMTSQDNNYTAEDLNDIFTILPSSQTPNYNLQGQFLTIDNPGIKNYQELWGVNLFAKDIEGLAKKGDLIMTLDDGKGNVIYYRLLRKVK